MNNFLKMSVKPLSVAIVAIVLILVDSVIAPMVMLGVSFVWMAFINWIVFFNSTNAERFKAIIGYVIGYFAANSIVMISSALNDVSISFIPIATIFAVFVVNYIVMYFENAKKWFIDSIPGIFIGISLTFSGAGVYMEVNNLMLLFMILTYGILGLLGGMITNILIKKFDAFFGKKKKRGSKNKK